MGIFHSYGNVTITCEGLQILIYALHSWPLSIAVRVLSVPHLPWYGASVYDGHFRGPLILTPVAERLTVELSLPVFTTYVSGGWDLNTLPSAWEANALTDCVTAAVILILIWAELIEALSSTVKFQMMGETWISYSTDFFPVVLIKIFSQTSTLRFSWW